MSDLTPQQQEAVDAYLKHGDKQAAANALGISRASLRDRLKYAAKKGVAPGHFEHGTATGFAMGKVTVQRGPSGAVERTWERQSPEAENAQAALQAAAKAFAQELPRALPIVAPERSMVDLLNIYTLTDAHVGMLAWHREGGQDWDLTIAENTIVGCFAEAIRQAPHSGTAILNQLGDLLHYDSLMAVTPTSGHILDADGRFTKMVETAIRIIRRLVALILSKHAHVHIIMAEGNHDMASSVWLRTMMKALYEDEPRITVDDSALPYYCHVFGEVFNGFHHTHLRKMPQLPAVMAAQFAKEWGATTKRYCHTGDKHHARELDENGIHIIQHPTVAARDAYAARGGWYSERFMQGMTFHKKFGLVGRVIVTPEMIA